MPKKSKKKTSIVEVIEPPRRKTYADEKDPSLKPDFIYGGPFIQVKDTPQFLDTITPLNVALQGTFKQSFAYYSLKERLPIILTKVIDQLSKQNDDSSKTDTIQYIAKLKSDLIRNKKYDLFTLQTPQTRRWNEWICQLQHPYYFTNTWVFTECYVYARLWEGFQLNGLKDYDPFQEQKEESFALALEPMCVVATKMLEMLPESEDPDKFKMDFVTLLKLSLWSNRCDLSLTAGEQVTLKFNEGGDASSGIKAAPKPDIKTEPVKPPEVNAEPVVKDKGKKGEPPAVETVPPKPAVVFEGPIIDPFKMIVEFKDRILVDDSNKIAKQIVNKSMKMAKKIEDPIPFFIPRRKTPEEELENPEEDHTNMLRNAVLASSDDPNVAFTAPSTPSTAPSSAPSSANPSTPGTPTTSGTPSTPGTPADAPSTPIPEGEEGKPNYPCFAKMTKPREIIFDIVCDNAGYELFTDLCLGHYLVSQKLVQKVRFHVKKIPWFVSDVTEKDFQYVIKSCSAAKYRRELPPEEKKEEPKVEPSFPEGAEAVPLEEQPAKPEPPPVPRWLTAEPLQQLGNTWQQFLENGTFILMSDDFWVSPHVYSDMKKYAYNVYRSFQFSLAILFKGDLNYRKLMGEINWAPQTKFPAALRTFKPAPVIALRTVKAEVICGLRKKKLKKIDQIAKIKPKWKETGEYGLIQYCAKAERLKVSEQPCPGFIDYKRREPEPPPEPEPKPEAPRKSSKVAFNPDTKTASLKGSSPTSTATGTPTSTPGGTPTSAPGAPGSATSASPTGSATKTNAPNEKNPK